MTLLSRSTFLLPPELVERILLHCSPQDVACFSKTCREYYALVYKSEDQFLWRGLFLRVPFDDLREGISPPTGRKPSFDWKGELQRRIEAEAVVVSGTEGPAFTRALEALLSTIETSLPDTETHDTDSANLTWLADVLSRSRFHRFLAPPTDHQLQCRLRAYLALSHEDGVSEESRRRLNALRRASRCYVYDLRKYSEETEWGPYRVGARGQLEANWEHVEHIVTVAGMKLRELPSLALEMFGQPKWGLPSLRAYSAPMSFERKPNDWAGISGVWRRFVCFMDYRDLFAFNYRQFSRSHSGPRDASFFDNDYQEAIRPVELHLDVVDEDPIPEDIASPGYPPLKFKGFSRGSHSGDAVVEGTVALMVDGAIRWTFITKYDGLTQWSAEGIQLGNVCSAAGVAGIWTGAFHEEADPAGPFIMWKATGPLPFNV